MRIVEKMCISKIYGSGKIQYFHQGDWWFLCIFLQFGAIFGKNTPRGIEFLPKKPTSLDFVFLYKQKNLLQFT